MLRFRFACLLLAVPFACENRVVFAQALVAETEPLTPAEQQKKFHLPPGFEIELVASEPTVHKPMNMKFDAQGRLWVTHSLEYPFPATDGAKARDEMTILSDLGPDGLARKSHVFANHLNIPIGLLPLSAKETLAWSIPHIYRLRDTNGDGVADERTVAFGPFGATDTHGNQNAFTHWIDGWVYANHGFSNESHVKVGGQGPDVLHMHSGNTYRFRADGSRIEGYSYGQVNPFGLSFDPLGNLYSADCHSCAVTMLLRGGYYQSFGKPHDGLGFAPETTQIDHGGTGIAGVVYSTLPAFPPEFRDVLFVGNVITNRVHCDRLKWTGSTPTVETVQNFITCDDPWFRPVDLQQGPDGALYIADFYNCIIGHYEVPLEHPKRDRERGRIWRVVYKGDEAKVEKAETKFATAMPDLTKSSAEQLFALLAHPNLTVRAMATNQLIEAFPKEGSKLATELLSQPRSAGVAANDSGESLDDQLAHAVWVVQRTGGLDEKLARGCMDEGRPRVLQVHAMRALGETTEWQAWQFDLVRAALENEDAFVRRAAAEALSKHPAIENLIPLLDMLARTDVKDTQLRHATRIAIRDQIRSSEVSEDLLTLKFSPEQRKQFVAFAISAPVGPAALVVVDEALERRVGNEVLISALPAAAKYLDEARIDALVPEIERRFPGNAFQQAALYRVLADGLMTRGMPLSKPLEAALVRVIESAVPADTVVEWFNMPLVAGQVTPSPWVPQQRACRGAGAATMISSLPAGGEHLGGVLHSPAFKLPATLSFWMCGHNGPPNAADLQQNYVRLVLEDGREVARSYPPRDDIAQQYTWDLSEFAGQRGHVEVVDGITSLDGFAWLAVGRFQPAVVSTPREAVDEVGAGRATMLRMAGPLKLRSVAALLATVAAAPHDNLTARLGATESLAMLEPEQAVGPLAKILGDAAVPTAARERAAQQLGQIDRAEARDALKSQLRLAPESVAVLIATGLASRGDSATGLLAEIRAGRAPATLLREPTVADRLKSSGVKDIEEQIAELTADLQPADDRIKSLIAQRRAGYLTGKHDAEIGRAVFVKSVCASCHKIGDVGKTIGPALDGIGNRGLDRLLEDTLDPSQNVDAAFRSVTIITTNGQVLSGFGLREEGETLVYNDENGQQQRLPLADIDERVNTTLSPMPANMIENIPEQDYYALLAFLLSQQSE